MKIRNILLVIAVLVCSSAAIASETGEIALGAKAGTLGLGLELNYPVSKRLTVTAGINKYSSTGSDTADGIDYDVDLNLQTVALLANFHPLAGSFRITAGMMINNNELEMTADCSSGCDVGGTTYNAAEVGTLKATVDFNKYAPYAGVGFGHSSSSGLGFMVDIGVLMQGSPNVELSSTGGTASGSPALNAELEAEEENAEDDIKGFNMYPVLSAGINYRF